LNDILTAVVVAEDDDGEHVELVVLGEELAKHPRTGIERSRNAMTTTIMPLEAIAPSYARR